MGRDEEKAGLLQRGEGEEEVVVAQDRHCVMGEKATGCKQPSAVMKKAIRLTAVAVATLFVVMTMHSLCARHHYQQQQHDVAAISDVSVVAPPSHVAEVSNAAAITVDDGRYIHDAVAFDDEANQAATPTVLKRQSATASANTTSTTTATVSSATATGTVLVNFQVHQPVLTPDGATLDDGTSNGDAGSVQDSCQVVLMDHIFAYSYGEPYVGTYEPPSCEFNRVVMNFTVVSEGRQYDRLALMYFNDTEVWRTSTAEPTSHPGIRWTYLKDMTEYFALWNAPQKLIFDLGNLVTDVYTGTFNTTLTATFFLDDDVAVATAPPADLILPISKRLSSTDAASQFTLPADNATNTIAFPRNAQRAVFSVSATGQASEEFWWSNVLQSDVDAFAATAGTFPGYSPWREVQVYIDGQLAGVDWPFPVVFTGGVVPSLHRPVAGPDAFDLKEHEIDITPWLGVLSDGNNHTFSIVVAGLLDDGGQDATVTQTVGSSWYVTGKIFVWVDDGSDGDDGSSITTGTAPSVSGDGAPTISVAQTLTRNANGTVNETLTYDTAVARSLRVSAQVTRRNRSSTVTWTQDLSYSNKGFAWAQGYAQLNDFLIRGRDEAVTTSSSSSSSAGDSGANYTVAYRYPLWCNTSYGYSDQGNLTLYGHLIQGQKVAVQGAAVFPDGLEAFAFTTRANYSGSLVNTTKNGEAYYFGYADGSGSTGYGSTDQEFYFGGFTAADADTDTDVSGSSSDETSDESLYYRHVEAVNSTITYDLEILSGSNDSGSTTTSSVGLVPSPTTTSVSTLSQDVYAQAPLGGGYGGPRLFMNRQGIVDGH